MTNIVNTGTIANDGTGDALRSAFAKINSRFEQFEGNVSLNERFQGSFGSDPTLRTLGGALQEGDWYYNTALGKFKLRISGAWVAAPDIVAADYAAATGLTLLGFKRSTLTNAVASTLQLWHNSQIVNLLGEYLNGSAGSAATNTTALENAMADLASGGAIYIGAVAGDFNLNALTVSTDRIRIVVDAATTLRWQTLGSSTNAITVEADHFSIVSAGGKLRGPSSGAYVGMENGIHVAGGATGSRRTGFVVEGLEIYNFGAHGIYGLFTDDCAVRGNHVHHCGYGGIVMLSCDNGTASGNKVHDITPGSASNMYGISLTHDSVGYSGGGRAADNPFCRGWSVFDNEIYNINWEAIDTHGAYEVKVFSNRIYATKNGISLTGSSGDAANYAGEQNIAFANIIDGRNRDGTTSSYENTGPGITLNGGSTEHHRRVCATANIIHYKGVTSNSNSGAIIAVLCDEMMISSNVISNWGGNGIYYATSSGTVQSNTIGDAADAADTHRVCVYDGNGLGRVSVLDNKHVPTAARTAAYGFRQVSGATYRPYLGDNDFERATTPFATNTATNFTRGDQQTNYVVESAGSATPSVADLQGAHGVLYLTNAGTYSITNLTSGVEGQIVTLYNSGAGTITFTRNNARLDASAAKVLSQYDTLTVMLVGAEWMQISYSANG